MATIKTAKDLRHAAYNPRTITASQLSNLNRSIESTGDLSGIVFNRRTRTLVSGHQRTKALKQWPSRAVLQDFKDAYGTVQIGHMEYKTDRGVIRVPMRVVDWDLKREKQANIAANTHGGDFDRQKLATLVAELETNKDFDIGLLGMDTHDLGMLRKFLTPEQQAADSAGDGESAEFESVLPKVNKAKENMACCPKCKFKFIP